MENWPGNPSFPSFFLRIFSGILESHLFLDLKFLLWNVSPISISTVSSLPGWPLSRVSSKKTVWHVHLKFLLLLETDFLSSTPLLQVPSWEQRASEAEAVPWGWLHFLRVEIWGGSKGAQTHSSVPMRETSRPLPAKVRESSGNSPLRDGAR